MGKIYQGIEGPISGKVGGVVGYVWKNRPCIRAYQPVVKYPNTESQQQQRSWFVSMVRFASKAKDALRLGMREKADEKGMTEGNYFVMCNKQYFIRENNVVQPDYEHLTIAEGSASDVYFHTPRFESDEVVTVEFDRNSIFSRSSGDDSVYVYFYAPSLGEGYLSEPVLRRSKSLSVKLPQEWSGAVVHLFGFVVDHAGRASRSTYIGIGRVNHYEERGRYIQISDSWKEFIDIAENENIKSANAPKIDIKTFVAKLKVEPSDGPPKVP